MAKLNVMEYWQEYFGIKEYVSDYSLKSIRKTAAIILGLLLF